MPIPNIDLLSREPSESTGVIPGELVLLNNYGSINPLSALNTYEPVIIEQMVICFVMQGKLKALINGTEVEVNGGQVLTTLPNSEGLFKSASDDCRFIMFIIYPDILQKTFEDIYINFDRTLHEKYFVVNNCTEEQMSIYQLMYTELKKECVRADYEYKMIVVRSYLNALLINDIQLFENRKTESAHVNKTSRQYTLFQKFLDALNKHASEERSVNFYANLLNVTPKYLSSVSMTYSQKNASQWIGEYVVHHAKTLMSVQHMSSAEIVEELQFQNLISFNRFFKRVAGITPKEYKKSLKNK